MSNIYYHYLVFQIICTFGKVSIFYDICFFQQLLKEITEKEISLHRLSKKQESIETKFGVINSQEVIQNQVRFTQRISDLKYKAADTRRRLQNSIEDQDQVDSDNVVTHRTLPVIPVLPPSVEELQRQIIQHNVRTICMPMYVVQFAPPLAALF